MTIQEAIEYLEYESIKTDDVKLELAIDIILEEVDKLQQLYKKAEKLRKYLEG